MIHYQAIRRLALGYGPEACSVERSGSSPASSRSVECPRGMKDFATSCILGGQIALSDCIY